MNPDKIPDKWAKYELLDEFELLAPDYLAQTIHRYTWENRFRVLDDLEGEFCRSAREQFFVVKFVPVRLCYLIPNIRIHNIYDIDLLRDALYALDAKYEEIWFCRTLVDEHRYCVAGRIVIDNRTAAKTQTIEQVWKCSPRLIQDFGRGFPYAYLMATRPGWGWRFQVQKFYIPDGDDASEMSLRKDFGNALRAIFEHREKLAAFEEFLFDCGCHAISLEYKIEGSNLQFIDWDTHQDREIISHWQNLKNGR